MQTVLMTPVNHIWILSEIVGKDNLFFLPNGIAFADFQDKTAVAYKGLIGILETEEVLGMTEFLQRVSPEKKEAILGKYRTGKKSFLRDAPSRGPLQESVGNSPEGLFADFSFRDLGIDGLQKQYLAYFKDRENYFFQETERVERNSPFFREEDALRYPSMKRKLQSIAAVHLFTRLFGNSSLKPSMFSNHYISDYCPIHVNTKKNAIRIGRDMYCMGCGSTTFRMLGGDAGPFIGQWFDGDSQNIRRFLRPYYEFNHPKDEGLPEKIDDLSTFDLFGLLCMVGRNPGVAYLMDQESGPWSRSVVHFE